MSTLRISDAPLLPDVDGTEKIPTGGRGDYAISVDQIKDHIFQDVGKELVGLGNVDNTSDLDKPVSTAQQAALNLKADKTYVDLNLDLKADKTNVYTRSETTLALSAKADLVGGVVPENQIPSSFNDVLEFTTPNLPIIGESGKIYVTTDTNKTWRWATNKYAEISGWNPDSVSKSVTLPTYYTKEAGVNSVTGVADGAYFNVRSPSDESYVDEYQNIGGVPTPTGKSYPSSEKIKYIYENGAALPYKEGIAYKEGAVVVKDGVLQQWKDGVWESAIAGVVAVGSIADLLALPDSARREDLHYSVAGLIFSYNGSEFVNISGYITAEAFGAKFDGVASDTLPLQEAIEYADAKNVPLVTFRRQCFLAEAVVVKSIVWNSLGTEFVTSEVGKPAIVAFNEAPKLLGVFRINGAYDGTQSFPASVATAEHPAGSYAASTLDFLYSSLPTSSSDTGILFRFTQKQSGIRVGEVHAKRHGTVVYWLSNNAPTDEYTNDTVIDAIYHEDVWCGIVMFGAVDFRCKTVKGSYFRRLPPLENDPAHCVYLGDRANPNRSRDLTFDHVENVVTDRTPTADGVFSVKGADNVLIKTLIAREVPAGGNINGECRIQNLYSFADEKIIPFVWITDNNSEGGFWSREQAGTSICVIENAVVRNNTGRGSDVLGSQQMALFCCYGGSRLRGTYSSITVQNLDAVLGGVNPMYIAIQESDEVCMRGRVRYNNYLTNPALYNYGDNDGAFPTWAALYPVIFLWPDTEVTQTVELEIIGYRWAIGTSGAPVNATFTCVPKDKVATEAVVQGDIRKDITGYYSAGSSGLSSAVTWTPYPFSYSHMHSYRSRFKANVYGLRTPLYAEPPVQYDTSESTFRPYGQPVTAIRHTSSTKQINDVQSLPIGQTCRLLNVAGDVTLVHEVNQNALKCASAADYSAWLVADVVNMGGTQRLVAAY